MAAKRRVRAVHELRRDGNVVAEAGELGTVLCSLDLDYPTVLVAFDGPTRYGLDSSVGFALTVPEAWVEDATDD